MKQTREKYAAKFKAKVAIEALKERFLTDQYQDHIKAVFWEDITSSMTDYFQKKFFLYTL